MSDPEPAPDVVMDWVARYERAWRAPGTDTLPTLFIDDATYQPAPFREPWRGLAEISRMWEEERDGPDEDFTMTAELVAASGARAVVRVEVRYGPPVDQVFRDLWVLHFTADGRCAAFEEWPFRPPGLPGPPGAAG